MATLVLSAAGAAFGGAVGGSFAGLTSLALGKAVGATFGSVIDQRLMGAGSAPVETGRVERFRIMGSSEGASLPRIFGRMRVAGQIIWSSRFLEATTSQQTRGKGGGGATVRDFSYSIHLALALSEGEILRVGRIWADGHPLAQAGLTWRLHPGTAKQLPDPLIAAVEGSEQTPAYRGTAYVVFENLDLTPFGNRIPQFNFEIFRRTAPLMSKLPRPPALDVRGVALIPGTGEYSLATETVFFKHGKGESEVLNVHNDRGAPDLKVSLDQLTAELPNAQSVALVVSWFGDDLRCDRCQLRPAVEQNDQDGEPMRWEVSGVRRSTAQVVGRIDGRPIFGGSPADAAVLQAIAHIKETGKSVMFYPFILMDIAAGNTLRDPWTGESSQPSVPWRGRITLSEAPGRSNTPDKTPVAADEVEAFFGRARASDFQFAEGSVRYTGPEEWSYRRFILHYAHLCARAGVDAFCIGSELRSLTQIRDGSDSYPAVRALCELAADARSILGDVVKIGYAADWSEYFGHQPSDGSGDVLFHLDPLWSHSAIDFIGIDNYMPLSDWREEDHHADAAVGSIYDLRYLTRNVRGGEGFDWFYADQAGRDAQVRLPIVDGAYGEDWVFRYKDVASWWSKSHTNRLNGVRRLEETDWQPKSKPIWFTEIGCPAIDKGTNQPNVFYDPKSSESFFPYYSSGSQDSFIQHRYLQATFAYWNQDENNPVSDIYNGRMVDMSRAHVWAWDARPWPDFPSRIETWIDGGNYARGHWINGRTSLCSLADVVEELCVGSGLEDVDASALHGGVVGYSIDSVETTRQSLQPLMLVYGFDSFANEGTIAFSGRNGRILAERSSASLVAAEQEPVVLRTRMPAAGVPGRVTLGFVRSDLDYQAGAAEAVSTERVEPHTGQTSVRIILSAGEAKAVAERWLSEGRVAQDTVAFSLPLSDLSITPGDVLSLRNGDWSDLYRVDRIDETTNRTINAVRVEPSIYRAPTFVDSVSEGLTLASPTPVSFEFMDLPLLVGTESPHAPHLAVTKSPWAGAVAVYSADDDFGYEFDTKVLSSAIVGSTLDILPAGAPGVWMHRSFRVRIGSGSLQSRSESNVLNGANAAAIRFGAQSSWEIIQFQSAELILPKVYRVSRLLRGQAGSDWVIPEVWPVGTDFVLLDRAVTQLNIPLSARGLARHYRIGPANRAYDDPSYALHVEAFVGEGLRPYRPVHFQAKRRPDGCIMLRWTRRTRVDGDNWQGLDVPLGEERELYHLRVLDDTRLLREFSPSVSQQIYSAVEQAADGAPLTLRFEVAQTSDRFGSGSYQRIVFNG